MEKQKALLERQRALETVINNSSMVVFLWKAEKYWPTIYVSENVRQFGYAPEDFISGRVLYGKIVHPEDLLLVDWNSKRTAKKGEKSSTASTGSLQPQERCAGWKKKPLYSATRKAGNQFPGHHRRHNRQSKALKIIFLFSYFPFGSSFSVFSFRSVSFIFLISLNRL